MLENERYNRAIQANVKYASENLRHLFLEQEFVTQQALLRLGVTDAAEITPSQVYKVGSTFMDANRYLTLRIPYDVEVFGTTRSGKTTMINRYLHELWQRDQRYLVHFVKEGARTIQEDYGDVRFIDPFDYSLSAGLINQYDIINSVTRLNSGMRMTISDRGTVDRAAFRRMLFSLGHVSPKVMEVEQAFQYGLESSPFQKGALIMLLTKKETSILRKKKTNKKGTGFITNMEVLPRLLEQYLRLHIEIIEGKIPFRIYTCIDAEQDEEAVYEEFRSAMDMALNLPETVLATLAKVFPNDYDEMLNWASEQNSAEKILGKRLGASVKIVGGDDLLDTNDILNNVFAEAIAVTPKAKEILSHVVGARSLGEAVQDVISHLEQIKSKQGAPLNNQDQGEPSFPGTIPMF